MEIEGRRGGWWLHFYRVEREVGGQRLLTTTSFVTECGDGGQRRVLTVTSIVTEWRFGGGGAEEAVDSNFNYLQSVEMEGRGGG